MNSQLHFIDSIKDEAIKVCQGTGLFPSLMIGQCIWESGWGKSVLAAKHNNYFGIKANVAWQGKKVLYKTTEYQNGQSYKIDTSFRSYPTIEACFADRIHFLQSNPRYKRHGLFSCNSPEEQATCLLEAGYATDPNYPNHLIKVINTYQLKKYDNAL
ncbi:glycoside hydrolase family 73 protein [Mucilaginibacter lacusdianchii]|uniref:glycoside hydrolase family 73 protein n=1 Tax=Mucilaginibacter lacusdianchii TaxID=2684211 RepID=UPI00131E7FE3|nr:glycoside hydrolase family 73 protein [Mucilaginibacter sp. JXJ CY 39]